MNRFLSLFPKILVGLDKTADFIGAAAPVVSGWNPVAGAAMTGIGGLGKIRQDKPQTVPIPMPYFPSAQAEGQGSIAQVIAAQGTQSPFGNIIDLIPYVGHLIPSTVIAELMSGKTVLVNFNGYALLQAAKAFQEGEKWAEVFIRDLGDVNSKPPSPAPQAPPPADIGQEEIG